jgi:putative ABC transport system permease protein
MFLPRQLLRDLGSQKLRTFLTVCGMVWGTTAVSLLIAFGDGFHTQMIRNSRGLGNNIVIAWPSRTGMPFEGMGEGRRIALSERDIDLLRERALTLGALSAEFSDELTVQHGSQKLTVDVNGVEPPFGEMRNLIPTPAGRFLNPIDEDRRRRVAFLGDELARDVFGEEEPVGQTIRLQGSPFLVVGVMEEKIQNSNYTGPDANKLFIPASTFRALTGQRFLDNFIFTASEAGLTSAAVEEVRRILAGRHRFHPGDEEALQVWDTTEMAQFLNTFMLAFRLFLGIVGSLTLVVGGIGVSNIMNVVVEERTREIGIKMALGAKPRGVMAQLLLETLAISAVGGALGLGLSAIICSAFPSAGLTDFVGDPVLTPVDAAVTVGLLGMIALISGYFPARTASRMDPVVAMKM